MNRQTNDDESRENRTDESRTPENWLSSLARVYGGWHLGITAIQSAVWTAFVYWNESGKQDAWADVVQTTVEKMLLGVPGISILSIIILAGIQKGGGMVLTFVDKRKKKLEKERAEGREEGRAEERAAWTAWNARRIQAEKRGEPFDEPPPSINGR